MASREVAEGVVCIVCFGAFWLYHFWLFVLRGKGTKVSSHYHDYFQAGKLARSIWAEACASDEKDAILGVQQARNAMSSCTYLATIAVALATAGITIVFDQAKTDRIAELAVKDPIMRSLPGSPLVPPVAILGAALGCLYCSFICFAQSIRLYVHTGFYIRAATSRFNPGTLTVAEAKRVTIHAGFAFSVGLRLFYFFAPLVMWSLGVTSLIISTAVMLGLIAYLDHFDMPNAVELRAEQAETLQRLTTLAAAREQEATSPGSPSAARRAQRPPQQLEALQEDGASSRPPPALATQQSAASGRRTSAAHELDDEMVAHMC